MLSFGGVSIKRELGVATAAQPAQVQTSPGVAWTTAITKFATQPVENYTGPCWHDSHPLQGTPVQCPVDDSGSAQGYFCSQECAYAWAQKHLTEHAVEAAYRQLRRDSGLRVLRPAPPAHCLQFFGGPVKIEDYRAGLTVKCLPLPARKQVGYVGIVKQQPEIKEDRKTYGPTVARARPTRNISRRRLQRTLAAKPAAARDGGLDKLIIRGEHSLFKVGGGDHVAARTANSITAVSKRTAVPRSVLVSDALHWAHYADTGEHVPKMLKSYEAHRNRLFCPRGSGPTIAPPESSSRRIKTYCESMGVEDLYMPAKALRPQRMLVYEHSYDPLVYSAVVIDRHCPGMRDKLRDCLIDQLSLCFQTFAEQRKQQTTERRYFPRYASVLASLCRMNASNTDGDDAAEWRRHALSFPPIKDINRLASSNRVWGSIGVSLGWKLPPLHGNVLRPSHGN